LGVSDVAGLMEQEHWGQVVGEDGGYECGTSKLCPTTPMPGITKTPAATYCETYRCQYLLCFAKECN